MSNPEDADDPQFRCSFCGKSKTEVRRLIAGPQVFICDECVALCAEILQADSEEAT